MSLPLENDGRVLTAQSRNYGAEKETLQQREDHAHSLATATFSCDDTWRSTRGETQEIVIADPEMGSAMIPAPRQSRRLPMRRTLVPLIALSLLTSAFAQTYPALPKIYYVSYPSLDPVKPLTVAAQLRLPANTTGKIPAVVIVHGSSGIDSRGAYYADVLNKAGIATLEIDLWGARGLIGGAAGRPRGVPETLPDAYGALKYLAARPEIDPARIGILGFSWGGVVAMLTATSTNTSKYL